MRHPHGLRAAAGNIGGLPNIGDAFEGGFFAGLISHTANGVATHALIVAPAASGASGTGYTITTNLLWKGSTTFTAGTDSSFDGAANTAAMITAGIAAHPAAQFCVNLSIGGYNDWYLPAPYELEIAYFHLKTTTSSNNTTLGSNPYSVPVRSSNYTTGNPAQTTVIAFQTGGSEAFISGQYHWSSQQNASSASLAWGLRFSDGSTSSSLQKNVSSRLTRAFRRIAL